MYFLLPIIGLAVYPFVGINSLFFGFMYAALWRALVVFALMALLGKLRGQLEFYSI